MKEKLCGVIVILILLISNIIYPVYAITQSDLNQQQKEINEKKEEQKQIKQELSEELREISKLDVSIAEKEEEIAQLSEQIEKLENSIAKKEKELVKKQKEHDENQELLEERLVVMYETGETSFLDMLFSSNNIVEFISNYYMLQQITQCDRELLDSIEKEEQQIEETKQALEDDKQELDATKNEKVTKNNLLKADKTSREQKASQLSEEDKQLQQDIEEYQEQYDRMYRELQESLRNKSTNSEQIAGLKFDGSFIWPCDNTIVTSCMKIRWGRWHKGIDIGARYENVYAAASGYAYTLENPSGYGHYIIIFHGNGYATLYGHLNAYKISYGQYVSQGQVIAQSGNTGSSQGAHLHFEVRKASSLSNYFNAQWLDPLDYLPGGYSFAAGAQTPS